MSSPEDYAPLSVELDADDIQRLWDGETIEILTVSGERSVEYLEINWRMKGVIGGRTPRDEWPELFGEGGVRE